jgi:aminoglycoside phosphotransferase (APT) family kinase protein
MNITTILAGKLIIEQFPRFSHLHIATVEYDGHDNRTFHLGNEMLIRLPSAESYALKVPKEQKWLPILQQHISLPIPQPIAMGQPSETYPWHWSIYKWLDGKSINMLDIDDLDLECIAVQLAQFLKELYKIDISDANELLPGQHNWWRGDHISVYDVQARTQIIRLNNIINAEESFKLMDRAMSAKWSRDPVWMHGDIAVGNILIQDGKVAGIIDFGGMGIGDPACDLGIAYTLLKGESRKIFQSQLTLDPDTWTRAKAWVLWKSTFELCNIENKSSSEANKHKNIIKDILYD